MPLEIAPHAGFCMGVRRAVEAAERIAADGKPACTLGELIHNPQVVNRLREMGLPTVEQPEEAAGRRVLIRSHGVAPDILKKLDTLGSEVIDLTCPYVERLHRIVAEASAAGCAIVLMGEKTHPEVVGTAGWAAGPVYVISTAGEADALPALEQAMVCAQTTFPPDRWEEILPHVRARTAKLQEHCTICTATEMRQREAKELAARSDAMIVVGGRKSANTQKLFAACRALCPRTVLVECAAEIPPAFANNDSDRIGMTAGASTPDGSLKEVVTAMTDNENMNPSTPENPVDADFLEALNTSMIRVQRGQNLTGIVESISADEVYVSIPGKADGILKRTDMVNADEVKVGDEIEAEVVKTNDGEGNVLLSQRNMVNRKAWEELMAKYNANEFVDGVGKEAVKGGLIADVNGVRAFVPASQIDNRYVEKIGEFVGQPMKLKIIEIDSQKKRVVASRRAVIVEERDRKKKEAWERLEVGSVVRGQVRRLTDFGAFVDVGGVDGLIHITELSWAHVKHPSEVLKVGQEIDVKIKNLDVERGRIQLGYKELQPAPWDNAAEKYPVGSIVEGKVVRIVNFGAFVELEPGLDGLVHFTQVAANRVAKVEDAVSVGQLVHVKVLGVDTEQKRISLSIRQALEEEAMDEIEENGALDLPAEAAEEAAPVEEAAEEAAPAEETGADA